MSLPSRYRVVMNRKAGTTLAGSPSEVREQIRAGLSSRGAEVHIEMAKGRGIGRALARAAADPNAVVVLAGGDGTLSRALPTLLTLDRPCGVIGLGTLNLFPRDVGMIGSPGEQATRIANGDGVRVDLATINGRPFHSISGLGYFGLMAREREQMREALPRARMLGFALAMARSAARTRPFTVTMELESGPVEKRAYAIVVSNNSFHGTPWRRDTLADGKIEIIIIGPSTWLDKARLAWSVAFGRWRDDPTVETFSALRVKIDLGRPRVSVSTDGELQRERNPIMYEIAPKALSIFVAHPDVAAAPTA